LHTIDPTSPEPQPPLPPIAPTITVNFAEPEFTLLDVFLVVVAALVALFFCAMAAGIILVIVRGGHAINVKDPTTAVLLTLPIQLAAYVLTVGFMAFYVWAKYRVGFLRAVRWNMPAARLAALAVAGGAVLGFGSELAGGLLHRWMPKSLPIEQFFATPASAYALAAFGILVAPLVEELFFRGFLYPALARWTGRAVGVGLTAFLFAMLHASQLALAWAPLLVVFMVGTVLTLVRVRTNSVAACVLVHAGYNLTLFITAFFATGHFHHMEKM
jgi:membrane protease YdiL (CAAX protease family)